MQEATQELRQEFRQELQEVKKELIDRIAQSSQELRTDLLQRMDEHTVRLKKCIRDWRTEILKAFLPYQEAQRVRTNSLESGLTERMNIMEHRLFEIEKKLLLNPPAA